MHGCSLNSFGWRSGSVRGGGHRSPRGAVARVRGVSSTFHQLWSSRQRGTAAHARLLTTERSKAFPRAVEAIGCNVGKEDPTVRPPLGLVPQPRSQAYGGVQNHRLRAPRDLQLVRERGGEQPAQG